MVSIFISVTGPGTEDDLINGARETVARNGFQVGDIQVEQTIDGGLVGNLEVDKMPQHDLELTWNGYTVIAEMD